jgi:hypothetical protein
MPNENGKAYGLTVLSPLCNETRDNQSVAAIVRTRLRNLDAHEKSPLARVPNTYLGRMFVLDDVFYQGKPAIQEHLKSKYLVFVAELHGELGPYLQGMWQHAEPMVRELWEFCIGFDDVHNANDFVRYIKKCQVETTFYFNGSTDKPLAEQLKALYLKQELAKFAHEHQGQDAATLQQAFKAFVARVEPSNLAGPTWRPGASSLAVAVTGDSGARAPSA